MTFCFSRVRLCIGLNTPKPLRSLCEGFVALEVQPDLVLSQLEVHPQNGAIKLGAFLGLKESAIKKDKDTFHRKAVSPMADVGNASLRSSFVSLGSTT